MLIVLPKKAQSHRGTIEMAHVFFNLNQKNMCRSPHLAVKNLETD
jgi:hypothetical protein